MSFCIKKEKIEALKKHILLISKDGQIDKLVNMPTEQRRKFFNEVLDDQASKFLNEEFEKAIVSTRVDALEKLLRANIDINERVRQINAKQIKSIRGFIERSKNKKVRSISEIQPIGKTVNMNKEERLKFLQNILKNEKQATILNEEFEKAVISNKEKALEKKAEAIAKREAGDFGARFKIDKKAFKNIDQFDNFMQKNIDGYVDETTGLALSTNEMEIFKDMGENLLKKKVDFKNNPTHQAQLDYGRAILDLSEYTDELSEKALSLRSIDVTQRMKAIKKSGLVGKDKAKEYALLVGDLGSDVVFNLFRTLTATGEFSAMMIQGFGAMRTKNFWNTTKRIFFKKLSTPQGIRDLKAEIVASPLFAQAVKDNLTLTIFGKGITKQEDNFVGTIAQNIPVLGKLIGKADRAQSGFLSALRMAEYEKMMRIAKFKGETAKETGKEIAYVVNAFTGGSYIHPVLNKYMSKLLFSPRNTLATIQIFSPMTYMKLSRTARAEAFKNLIGVIGIPASILGLAYAIKPKSIEKDPTSSDFGKIKVGNQRYNVTGGKNTYITLLSRLISGKTKSTSTDIKTELGKDHGFYTEKTRGEVALNFLRSKLSPVASLAFDMALGMKNIVGEEVTVQNVAFGKLVPMYYQGIIDAMKDDPSVAVFLRNLSLGFIGLGAQTYEAGAKDWDEKTTAELKQFRQKIDSNKFKEYNKEYNKEVIKKIDSIRYTKEYKELTEEEKQEKITNIRREELDKIFKKENFKYRREINKK